jgi:hypothetical protein
MSTVPTYAQVKRPILKSEMYNFMMRACLLNTMVDNYIIQIQKALYGSSELYC